MEQTSCTKTLRDQPSLSQIPVSSNQLTWALVIATYKREHILLRCLKLAAQQTRTPQEIIVMDASPDYEKTQERVLLEFGDRHPHIRLIYVKANRPSLPAQRNQGADLSSADVLFLIDDDSLMYPTCAEEVMRVYEADTQKRIQGVSPLNVSEPPDLESRNSGEENQQGTIAIKPKQTWLRKLFKELLSTQSTYFLPYDKEYPVHLLPAELHQLNIGIIQVMAGFSMTFRRSILQVERFSEILDRYASGEDQDLSYRVSRHGAIVNAINARLCHLEISGGRLKPYTVAILSALNPAVLQKFYSSDIQHTSKQWRHILRRRVFIALLKDLSAKKWTFESARGIVYALGQLNTIYSKSQGELLEFYPKLQAQLIDDD